MLVRVDESMPIFFPKRNKKLKLYGTINNPRFKLAKPNQFFFAKKSKTLQMLEVPIITL